MPGDTKATERKRIFDKKLITNQYCEKLNPFFALFRFRKPTAASLADSSCKNIHNSLVLQICGVLSGVEIHR